MNIEAPRSAACLAANRNGQIDLGAPERRAMRLARQLGKIWGRLTDEARACRRLDTPIVLRLNARDT